MLVGEIAKLAVRQFRAGQQHDAVEQAGDVGQNGKQQYTVAHAARRGIALLHLRREAKEQQRRRQQERRHVRAKREIEALINIGKCNNKSKKSQGK